MQPFAAITVLALIFSASLVKCFPTEEKPQQNKTFILNSNFLSTGSSISSANGYTVIFSQRDVNGVCVRNLSISGHGINKKIETECRNTQPLIINLGNRSLLVDEYFTDTPGILVHLVGDKCEQEVFHEQNGKITSEILPLTDTECERVKVKIEFLKEEQAKWEKWHLEQQLLAQQHFLQIQQQLMSLQNLFGGFGFGIFG